MRTEEPSPYQEEIEGNLKALNLDPLCRVFSFPASMQLKVYQGLYFSYADLPTSDECRAARIQGESANTAVDQKYGAVADGFAKRIDPNFDPMATQNPETARLRGQFYDMIRTLDAEQVRAGVVILSQFEPAV